MAKPSNRLRCKRAMATGCSSRHAARNTCFSSRGSIPLFRSMRQSTSSGSLSSVTTLPGARRHSNAGDVMRAGHEGVAAGSPSKSTFVAHNRPAIHTLSPAIASNTLPNDPLTRSKAIRSLSSRTVDLGPLNPWLDHANGRLCGRQAPRCPAPHRQVDHRDHQALRQGRGLRTSAAPLGRRTHPGMAQSQPLSRPGPRANHRLCNRMALHRLRPVPYTTARNIRKSCRMISNRTRMLMRGHCSHPMSGCKFGAKRKKSAMHRFR